jgi:hypothetical protein
MNSMPGPSSTPPARRVLTGGPPVIITLDIIAAPALVPASTSPSACLLWSTVSSLVPPSVRVMRT